MSSVNGNRYPDNEPNKDMTKPIFITSQSPSNTKPIDLSRLKIRKQIEAYNSILSLFITQGSPMEENESAYRSEKCSDYNKGNSSSQIGIFTIIRFSSSHTYFPPNLLI